MSSTLLFPATLLGRSTCVLALRCGKCSPELDAQIHNLAFVARELQLRETERFSP